MTEHLCNVEVEGFHTVALYEGEMSVACGLADDVERCSLALGNLLNMVEVALVDEQPHALLALVGDDFLRGEGLVADGKLCHVNAASAILYQLGEAVQVAGTSVVVDADDWVVVLLAEGTNEVIGTLLHFGISSLYGVQLDAAGVTACINAGDRTATETDAVVVATHDDNLVAFLRFLLQAVAARAVAYTTSQHDDLVVGVLSGGSAYGRFLMLEGEHGAADEGLAELVAEVGGTVRGLDEDLLWCLVKPPAHGEDVFPFPFFHPWVGGHVDSRSGDGP